MHNILYMAMTETHDIKELEHELLDPLHKLHFLYGTQDRYTPLSQVDVLKEIFPDSILLPIIMITIFILSLFCHHFAQ